jgi:threonine/homoserine/homoserine lactone efflux protein
MIPWDNFILFVIATAIMNATPGPDMMYAVSNAIHHGPKGGVASALGIGAGCIVHTLAAVLGVSALLAVSATAFTIVKWLGAVFLVYLGVKMIVSGRNASFDVVAMKCGKRLFWQGAATNVLNPKVALFFLSFLPQFVDPAAGPVALQTILLGAWFIFSGMIITSTVAIIAGHTGNMLKRHPRILTFQRWLSGSILVALGARLAFVDQR